MALVKCRECGREYPLAATHVCEFDFGPLEVAYDYDRIKKSLTRDVICGRPQTMWRYRELLPVAGEPVLEDPGPGGPPVVGAAQGGQGHPEVAGREDAELAPEPAGGAAVVGDGDHGGQVVDDEVVDEQPQRGQGRVQSVAAAEGDHGLCDLAGHGAHSRPRSRCTARASMPRSVSRATSASDMATLRCLPPVHPTATAMNRLPSTR